MFMKMTSGDAKGKKGMGLPWESAALFALTWEMPTEHQRRLGSRAGGMFLGWKSALDACFRVVMASSFFCPLYDDDGEFIVDIPRQLTMCM